MDKSLTFLIVAFIITWLLSPAFIKFLKKVGMVRLAREEFNISKDKQKYYRKIIEPSKQFSIFFNKLADEYETILDTAEMKRGSDD